MFKYLKNETFPIIPIYAIKDGLCGISKDKKAIHKPMLSARWLFFTLYENPVNFVFDIGFHLSKQAIAVYVFIPKYQVRIGIPFSKTKLH